MPCVIGEDWLRQLINVCFTPKLQWRFNWIIHRKVQQISNCKNRFMNIYILFNFKWNQLTYTKGEQNVYQSVYGFAFTFFKWACLQGGELRLCAMTQCRPRHSAWRSDSSLPLLLNSWKKRHVGEFFGGQRKQKKSNEDTSRNHFILTEQNEARLSTKSKTSRQRIDFIHFADNTQSAFSPIVT